MIQNNTGLSFRVGDKNTSATHGAALPSGSPGGSINVGPFTIFASNLTEWWIAGAQNNVIDVIYIQ